jgi:CubicO group peptidase (beta-lactamase class C family)
MVTPRCQHLIAAFVTLLLVTHLNAQQDDKRAIESTIRSYEQAVQDFDFYKANSLLAPDAVWIEEDSAPAPANQWPQWWQEAKAARLQITNRPHDFNIRIHGDVAHVVLFVDTKTDVDNETARAFTLRDHPNQREWQSTAVESEVLIKTSEGWRIALGHTSRLPQQTQGAKIAGNSDAALSARVDEAVARIRQEMKIPGTSLAVVRDGKIIKATGYGLANVELNVPVTPETIFQAGSTGKQFTAAAILMLAGEGKLSLDDSITKYFPEAPPSWKAITIRHLLTHTSGLPEVWGESEQGVLNKALLDLRRDYTEDELLRVYVKMQPQFPPGEKWEYCNTGYHLLGFLIHRLTGKFHGDFVRERIFQPLGMNTATVISEADIVPNRSSGYILVKGELKNQQWLAPSLNTTADGPYYMSVLDLAKWDAALYTEKILPRTTLAQMWTVQAKLNSGETYPYGFGWFLSDVNGHRLMYHTGGNQGFFVNISRYVDDRLTIILMNNMDEDHCDTLKISGAVASIYLPATKGKNPIKDW